MKIITDSRENAEKLAAEKIKELVAEKPDAVIGFATGKSLDGVYALLAGEDLSGVEAFGVCEYLGSDAISDELNEKLYTKAGICKIHRPDADNPEAYDDEIAACGGLDLVVLSTGLNGSIGFNEPATPFDSNTHIQLLTGATKRVKAEAFGGIENVPENGVTMGIKTIFNAKNVILTAFGEEEADVAFKLVYARNDTFVPAAMLQLHMNMTLFLDGEAAAKL